MNSKVSTAETLIHLTADALAVEADAFMRNRLDEMTAESGRNPKDYEWLTELVIGYAAHALVEKYRESTTQRLMEETGMTKEEVNEKVVTKRVKDMVRAAMGHPEG